MNFIRLNKAYFSKTKSISIDYAILEKTNNAYVIPTILEWNDLGTYTSLCGKQKKIKIIM